MNSSTQRASPYPIYVGRLVLWDILLPNGHLLGIRFRNYSRCAELLND